MRRFHAGESVVWRSIDREDAIVTTVWPWTVVSDSTSGIVMYMPVGTVGKQRTGERGGPRGRLMIRWDGGHRDVTWERTDVVRLYQEGDWYSIWIARDAASGSVAWRYVNLEEPWRRTPIGFDSRDLWLDLWSEPESDDWRWKDEDEVEWLLAQGKIDVAFAERARSEGERAVAQIRAGTTMLDPSWSTWRPDATWMIPALPDDWRELEPRRR